MSKTNKRSSKTSLTSSADDDEHHSKQSKSSQQQLEDGREQRCFRHDHEHEARASRLMRLQDAEEDRRQGSPAMGQRESTAGKSYTTSSAPAPNTNALKNKRWRQRKKLKMQQVEEDLANAELEREQLKNEQTMLREKIIVLLCNHHILGWPRVPPTGGSSDTSLTSQSLFAQAAASSSYGAGPLPPHARNTTPLAEYARAEGVANFCVAGLQQHELDHAVTFMLCSAYQQETHTTKEEDQQNMSYYAAAVGAQERIKRISNTQQYGGGTHRAAGPANLVASLNQHDHYHHWHEQEYRAPTDVAQPLRGSALYMIQLMARQQQLTNPRFAPPPQLQPDAHMHDRRNLSNLIGGVGRLPPMMHPAPIYNSHIIPFVQSLSGTAPFEFAPPPMSQEVLHHSSEVPKKINHPLARKKDETSTGSNSSEDGADLDKKPRAT
jgi:hypothetical protein